MKTSTVIKDNESATVDYDVVNGTLQSDTNRYIDKVHQLCGIFQCSDTSIMSIEGAGYRTWF